MFLQLQPDQAVRGHGARSQMLPSLGIVPLLHALPARPVEHTQTSLTPNITDLYSIQQKFFRIGSGFSRGGEGEVGLTTRGRSSARPTLTDTLPVGLFPTHQLVPVCFNQKGTNFESCLRILSGLKPHQRTGRVEKDPCRPNQGRTPSWVCFLSISFIFIFFFSVWCIDWNPGGATYLILHVRSPSLLPGCCKGLLKSLKAAKPHRCASAKSL